MKDLYIRFLAPVTPNTTDQLFQLIDRAIRNQYQRLHLMLSSPGGSVFHGLTIYNFLRGIPLETYTYNFGSVDSIGVVVYCAGSVRFSVPHARFLIHGVRFNQRNISRVIADTAGKPATQVEQDMHNRTTLDAEQAKAYSLVHEITSFLFPIDADFAVIRESPQNHNSLVLQQTNPLMESYTGSTDYGTGF